ncbi:hypothetical protein IWZ01DRAFT_11380 [Phyllosticta capitalensis]
MSSQDGEDLIGSRVVRPRRHLSLKSRSMPPPSSREENGDIIGTGNSRAAAPTNQELDQKSVLASPRKIITNNVADDEGDIIGRRFVPKEHWDETNILRSKWAPPAPSPRISPTKSGTSTPTNAPNGIVPALGTERIGQREAQPKISTLRELELERIRKLITRVSWKSRLLLQSQYLALSMPIPDPEHRSSYLNPTTMFKLDFFEFYVLLERTLVQLLAFFRISVPKNKSEDSRTNAHGASSHSFHANVLAALDRKDNPLRDILGAGDVRQHLETAKAFRNRWKDADDDSSYTDGQAWREEIMKLSLDHMVDGFMGALERSYLRCEEEEIGAAEGSSSGVDVGLGEPAGVDHFEHDTIDMDDAPWEAVEDAMEWEVG